MFSDGEGSTAAAALSARDRVERLAREPAHDERAASAVAEAALFEEALLGALKARLAELRTAAR
jgi:hypothetical protein